jgi:hypothetical protein
VASSEAVGTDITFGASAGLGIVHEGRADMAMNKRVEHPIGHDSLEPESRLQALLAVNRNDFGRDRPAFHTEADAIADLQVELLCFTVFERHFRRPGVVCWPPGALDQADVVDVTGTVAKLVLVVRRVTKLFLV